MHLTMIDNVQGSFSIKQWSNSVWLTGSISSRGVFGVMYGALVWTIIRFKGKVPSLIASRRVLPYFSKRRVYRFTLHQLFELIKPVCTIPPFYQILKKGWRWGGLDRTSVAVFTWKINKYLKYLMPKKGYKQKYFSAITKSQYIGWGIAQKGGLDSLQI